MSGTDYTDQEPRGDLHSRQIELWGLHDMRRKSPGELDSRCTMNATGRCDRLDCCLRRAARAAPRDCGAEQMEMSL